MVEGSKQLAHMRMHRGSVGLEDAGHGAQEVEVTHVQAIGRSAMGLTLYHRLVDAKQLMTRIDKGMY